MATSSLGIAGSSAGTWGTITGSLASQNDLQNALNGKLSLGSWYATTTDALAQGTTNKYFSNTLAQGAISVSGAPFTYSSGVIGINQANGAQPGFLASADWTTFNSKVSSSSLSAAYPLSYNNTTGVFSLGFGTTTANSWNSLQTFTGGATLGSATSTTFAITSIGNAILSTNTNGSVVATTSIGTNLLTGILSIGNGGTATSTQVTNGINYFDGTTITSSPALSFTGTNIIVGTNLNLNDGNGMYYSNPSAGSFNFGSMAGGGAYPLTLSSGNGSNFYTGTYFDISASGIGDVFGLTYYNGFFWASGSNNKVYKYNTDGTYTGTNFDTSGSGGTYGIAYYNGFFWITDYSANKVYKYDTSGTYTGVSFDTSASGDTSPVGITYYNGYFWIVSWTNKKVYQYNTDGTYAGTKFDTSPSGINTASGIAYYNGFFWITDYGSGKIYKVTTAGVYTGVNIDISSSGNTDPTGIVYYNGFLWSTGFTQKTIYKYSPDTYSGGYIALSTDGGERMRIDTAGNVGIGTSTPYSRLEVWGPDKAASTSAFLVTDSASDTEFAVLDNGNATLAGNLIQNSDQRLKTNIQTLDGSSSLTEIRALNPVTFYWIDPAKSAVPQYGFIAQQIQSVFPNLVSTTSPTTLTPHKSPHSDPL